MESLKTSSGSWQAALSRALRRAADNSPRRGLAGATNPADGGTRSACAPRFAVVGVGNELRGDDAAGVAVARELQPMLGGDGRVLVVDAGLAPEGCSGLLRRFGPDLVLFVDAADLGDAPGTVRLLGRRSLGGVGGSTHTLPLSLLAGYLVETMDCTVALLGIQPANTALGEPLSPAVGHAVRKLVTTLAERLGKEATAGHRGTGPPVALIPAQ